MIGVQAIGIYVPDDRLDAIATGRELGFDQHFIDTKLGFTALSRKSTSEETSDLAVRAVQRIPQHAQAEVESAQCIAVVTQNPDGHGLPHVSAIVHGKLKLPPSCFAFDISLGCSGFVAGLAIMTGFMERCGLSRGLLITADPYSKIVDPSDRNTALIFGDAATATLVTTEPVFSIGKFDLGTEGSAHGALTISENGFLSMSGRAVFDFALRNVPPSVERTLIANDLKMDQVDAFLFHAGSRYIVETLSRRLGVSGPFTSSYVGNTVSSSIPLMLAPMMSGTERIVLASGFGVGLGWATTVLRRH